MAIVDGAAHATSDGLTWRPLSIPGRVATVVQGGRGWLALGEAPSTLWTSLDGSTWNAVTLDVADVSMLEAAVGPDRFVVGGQTGGGPDNNWSFSSTDGTTFTSSSGAPPAAQDSWYSLGDGFVALDWAYDWTSPSLWTSPDGLSWQPIELASTFGTDQLAGAGRTRDGLVAITSPAAGSDAARTGHASREREVWTSPDGRSWLRLGQFTVADEDPDPQWEEITTKVHIVGNDAESLLLVNLGSVMAPGPAINPITIVKGALAFTMDSHQSTMELRDTTTDELIFRYGPTGRTSGTRPALRLAPIGQDPDASDVGLAFIDPDTNETVFSYTISEVQAAHDEVNPGLVLFPQHVLFPQNIEGDESTGPTVSYLADGSSIVQFDPASLGARGIGPAVALGGGFLVWALIGDGSPGQLWLAETPA